MEADSEYARQRAEPDHGDEDNAHDQFGDRSQQIQ